MLDITAENKEVDKEKFSENINLLSEYFRVLEIYTTIKINQFSTEFLNALQKFHGKFKFQN